MKLWIIFSLLGVGLSAGLTMVKRPPKEQSKMKQSNQELECYEQPNQGGSSVRLIDYAPNLGVYNFDNLASSCCFNGIWILYDDYNYNTNNVQASEFHAWGENYCKNFDPDFNRKASSSRMVGARNGYKFDTINFYDAEHFMGKEQFFYTDAPTFNFDNLGRSLIVTGCSPWTIYEKENFQGSCTCVFPSDTTNCYPGFYETASSLGGLSQQVSSTRKGCQCQRLVMATNSSAKQKFSHEGKFIHR